MNGGGSDTGRLRNGTRVRLRVRLVTRFRAVAAHWFSSKIPNAAHRLGAGRGIARGIAHIGVLRVLEKNNIPIHAVAGVSSGAMVAAAMAGGSSADEIQQVALSMKFRDIARWTVNLLGPGW